jgi:hypothetical protein
VAVSNAVRTVVVRHGIARRIVEQDRTSTTSAPDARSVSRTQVELEAAWRRHGEVFRGCLVLVQDLSARGARIATWDPIPLAVGDRMELVVGDDSCDVVVRRVIGDTEFGVEFERMSVEFRMRVLRTIGANRVTPDYGWA